MRVSVGVAVLAGVGVSVGIDQRARRAVGEGETVVLSATSHTARLEPAAARAAARQKPKSTTVPITTIKRWRFF